MISGLGPRADGRAGGGRLARGKASLFWGGGDQRKKKKRETVSNSGPFQNHTLSSKAIERGGGGGHGGEGEHLFRMIKERNMLLGEGGKEGQRLHRVRELTAYPDPGDDSGIPKKVGGVERQREVFYLLFGGGNIYRGGE